MPDALNSLPDQLLIHNHWSCWSGWVQRRLNPNPLSNHHLHPSRQPQVDFDITLRQPWDNVGQQFESFCDGSSHQFTANRFYEALYPLRGVQILWRVFGAIRFPHRTEMFNKALIFVFKKISYEKELFSISNCYKKIQLAIFFVFHKLT